MNSGNFPVLYASVAILWPLFASLAPRRVDPAAAPRLIGLGLLVTLGWIAVQFFAFHRVWGVLFLASHATSVVAVALVARVLPFDWPGPMRWVGVFVASVVGFLVGLYSVVLANWS